MSKPNLARLKKVDLREYWENEAQDFTPWLGEEDNISLLGETIGMELEVEAQEKAVGPFQADILCKDTLSENWVLIENQLERTDHTHLGQLIAYAAGLKAVTIIWIANRFTDEHRAALDWLNEITEDKFSFFGIEVELWRIADSPIAPKFNIVSKPNDWSRSVRSSTTKTKELTPAKQTQLAFWSKFKEYMEQNNSKLRWTKPLPQHWMNHSIGRSGFSLCSIASTYSSHNKSFEIGETRVELVLDCPDSKKYFALLEDQRVEIEKKIGESLTWYNPEEKRVCKIYTLQTADIKDESKWDEQHAWLKDKLELFQRVFKPIVRKLNLEEVPG